MSCAFGAAFVSPDFSASWRADSEASTQANAEGVIQPKPGAAPQEFDRIKCDGALKARFNRHRRSQSKT
jgi:hypothetical protein